MRKVPSLGTVAAVAMADFNIHLSPPVATTTPPPPPPPANCDAHKCPWWPYTSSKDFKANTALILVVLFCALICALAFNAAIRYAIRLHCTQRRRRNAAADDQKPDPARAAAVQAPEIPALVYTEEMKMKLAECIICLSEFAAGEKVRILEKCGHGFHLHCIQTWLVSHSSCPTCRTDCSEESTPSPP